MEDAEERQFGKVIFGDDVKRTRFEIAKNHKKKFKSFEDGSVVKEDFDVVAVMCGMDTGKSTLLQRHLQILRENITHPPLLKLLEVESCPLV